MSLSSFNHHDRQLFFAYNSNAFKHLLWLLDKIQTHCVTKNSQGIAHCVAINSQGIAHCVAINSQGIGDKGNITLLYCASVLLITVSANT